MLCRCETEFVCFFSRTRGNKILDLRINYPVNEFFICKTAKEGDDGLTTPCKLFVTSFHIYLFFHVSFFLRLFISIFFSYVFFRL